MTLNEKQRKALLKRKKKRDRQPRPIPPTKFLVKHGAKRRYTDNHPLVLFAIEKAILGFHTQHGITDQIVRAGLRKLISNAGNPEGLDDDFCSYVAEARQEDLDDATWIDGLRVAYTSADTYDGMGPMAYLDMVRDFVRSGRAA